MLLAIDTASKVASIALYDGNGVQGELSWKARENHTVELMNEIIHLLDVAKITKPDLQAIGISLGPGSFTGLRVGLAVAKGLAFGTQIPILGVPTLDAIARAHVFAAMPLWVVISAGRGRYSTARYAVAQGECKRASDYALVNAAQFAELAVQAEGEPKKSSSRLLFCGEIDAALKAALGVLEARAVFAPPSMNVRRAGYLAELAWKRLEQNEADDVDTLAPLYTPHEV